MPTLLSITGMAVATLASAVLTWWTATGQEFDSRHVAGFLLGCALTGLMFAQSVMRAFTRSEMKVEKRYRLARIERTLESAHASGATVPIPLRRHPNI